MTRPVNATAVTSSACSAAFRGKEEFMLYPSGFE
jgi:hypothetical protein